MAKLSLADLLGGSIAQINSNFTAIKNVLNNKVLWRDNPTGEPNQMLNGLDMNSKRILNLPAPIDDNEPARKIDVVGLADVQSAVEAARQASVSAGLAASSSAQAISTALAASGTASAAALQLTQIASAVGSTLVGYGNNDTVKSALDVLYYGIQNVRSAKFAGGAKGDSVTSDSNAVQAACDAAGYGGNVYFPAGRYFLDRPIICRGATKLIGDGVECSIIYRTGDYGDTFVCGTAADQSEPARSFGARGLQMVHGDPYSANSSTINFKATKGAHIRMRGAQEAMIQDCWFHRLPYQVYSEGGSWVKVINCQFLGVYDPSNTALQEGRAQLVAAYSAVHGNPTTWIVKGNNFLGATFERVVTYPTINGAKNVNRVATIGSQFGFLIDGLEDLDVSGNYFGGQSVAELAFIPSANAGIIDIRIAKNFFDGIAEGSGILFAPNVANKIALAVSIDSNVFTDNLHGIFINQNSADGMPSVYNATLRGNTFLSGIGSQMLLNGLKGFVVSGNTVADWNKYAFTATDAAYTTGINVYGASSQGQVTGNTIGAGSNLLNNSVDVNQCYVGISVTVDNVYSGRNYYMGIRDGANFRTGMSGDENQITVVSGSYQIKTADSIILVNATANANSAIALPVYPIQSREIVVKDSKGNAGAFSTTVTTNDGSLIDGASTNVISTNYGFRRYRFNGASWNVIG